MFKKEEIERKKSKTYAYQDTDSFWWGFDCAPQTLEIADPAMTRSKFERKFMCGETTTAEGLG